VAHTTTQAVDAAGSTTPDATRITTFDNGNQPVSVQRQYSDGSADRPGDGVRRVGRVTADANELTWPTRTRRRWRPPRKPRTRKIEGLPQESTEPLEHSRARQPADQQRPATAGQAVSQGTKLTYDPAGRIAPSTDPDGRDAIQLSRRRDGRHSHHSVGHRGDRF
jgi:YD repeat-containing protein